MRHQTFLGDYVSSQTVGGAKVGIPCTNNPTKICSVTKVVKKLNHLFRNRTPAVTTTVRW